MRFLSVLSLLWLLIGGMWNAVLHTIRAQNNYSCLVFDNVMVQLDTSLYVFEDGFPYSWPYFSPDEKYLLTLEAPTHRLFLENLITGKRITLQSDVRQIGSIFWLADRVIYTWVKDQDGYSYLTLTTFEGHNLVDILLPSKYSTSLSEDKQYLALWSAPESKIKMIDVLTGQFVIEVDSSYEIKLYNYIWYGHHFVQRQGRTFLVVDPESNSVFTSPLPSDVDSSLYLDPTFRRGI